MRFIAVLMLACSLGLFADTARAQEARLVGDVDATSEVTPAPRTPTLVLVNETVKPAPDAKAGAQPKPSVAKSTTAKAAPTPTMVAAQPIIMSGAPATTTVESIAETTGNPKYDEYVKQSAARNGVDPNLVISVMRHESGFNYRARSYKGATGLMQLMPATAARFGVTNIYDPQQNIEGGTRYLRFLLDQFNGDIALVLAGYNAGENAVVNSGYRVPRYRETQAYVKNISARYDRVKSSAARTKAATSAPTAPAAETFSGGRLSNNY
ncbi:MAG TPA: transglycosylase SLT domain-containing protein [Blastocatellia bacterium]|nr:transglycosylase SLT domain-containing protein [Blastocatellia bacterium]